MNTKLLAKLEDHMRAWVDENCEEGYWPQDMCFGAETANLMARAAASVVDAIEESQNYAVKEGFLAEAPPQVKFKEDR